MIKPNGDHFLIMDPTGTKILGKASTEVEAHKLERKHKVSSILKGSTEKNQGRA